MLGGLLVGPARGPASTLWLPTSPSLASFRPQARTFIAPGICFGGIRPAQSRTSNSSGRAKACDLTGDALQALQDFLIAGFFGWWCFAEKANRSTGFEDGAIDQVE